MNTPTLSLPLRRGRAAMRRSRRATRFALSCESLESRQLLSVGQTGLAASVLVNPSVVNAQVFIPATVSNLAPPSYVNLEIVFGTFGGLNQVQVIVSGSAPVFSPTPVTSSGGAGSTSPVGTLSGNSGTSQTGLGLNAATTPSNSITPLNPGATSGTYTPGAPVYVVPAPLAPPAVHLGASTAPATAQSNSTLISNLDEMPSPTRFGQGDALETRRLFMEQIDVTTSSSSLLDYVEPFRAINPAAAPQDQPAPQGEGEQAPAPAAAPKAQALPPVSDPNIDAALGLTDGRVLTQSRDGDAAEPDNELSRTNTSWSFSAIFGAAAIASGGYHLAMREADRVRGRWIPRWAGAERPTKRRTGLPPR